MARAPRRIQWLSDNGPQYTAKDTRDFGRDSGSIVCTTPSYSPESNGMAEAFVKTLKRDYAFLAKLDTAAGVIAEIRGWIADYLYHPAVPRRDELT